MKDDLMARIQKVTNNRPHVLGHKHFQSYSVLLPLIKINDDIHIIFEKRAEHLRRQPGEICFPGGRIEKGQEDSQTAALREATEELRITEEDINLVGPLDFFVSSSDSIIYPFVGWIEKEFAEISPNPDEVSEIFTVPVSFLLNTEPKIYQIHYKIEPEDNFPYHLIPDGKDYNWRPRNMKEYFYCYEDKVIWGMTARMLNEFLENIN
ncbi:NUDIX hydrolase [Schinkia azotoformans]|uniref:NUDIX hydrolase n=2 Tax=Schinkia azotoformans TaxID=1454 RepID=UPI002DB78E02|nr:CoA pyrophosphatase [Schinkia azotoformans]MEC1696943.1 CoA pyrophosphatase [Schinkia azotoformans]MEC1718244.1 CoA pyrophosphatase [Schinkia azotoformans]MEC1725904.1 CoA pyrophosphatase [Schinkia azotoformans]MEC1747169.1 CoA pyrophosphatase [Schinkia azotoformans]MEC1757428.1 CoA pyrophosphatase [Schinkia azotoformans]